MVNARLQDYTAQQLAACLEHTLLKPEAGPVEVAALCREARQYSLQAVCVNPLWVQLAVRELAGSSVQVVSVVGFPLGAATREIKALEARQAVADGAAELDMVLAIGALKAGQDELVRQDVAAVVEAAGGRPVKVILETALLTTEEKRRAAHLAVAAGASFLKTSTGFGPGGATVSDVKLLRELAGTEVGVKAAGGIKTLQDAREMLAAGADRLGASQAAAIMAECLKQTCGE